MASLFANMTGQSAWGVDSGAAMVEARAAANEFVMPVNNTVAREYSSGAPPLPIFYSKELARRCGRSDRSVVASRVVLWVVFSGRLKI